MSTTYAADYLRVEEAAKLLGVCGMTVRRWADAGKLEMLRTPYGRAISRAAVERMRRAVQAEKR